MTAAAPHLIYFADPMCSWCWGFAPVIAALDARWGERLPIRLILGGLRPGTTTPMTAERAAELRAHWRAVAEASGQRFDASLAAEGFVYDTDPAARAVVAARRARREAALLYLEAAQRAFYVEGRDVTQGETLADIAEALGLDGAAFAVELASEAVREETRRDHALSRNAGVTGFPTLILGPRADGHYETVTRGFRPAAETLAIVEARLGRIVASPSLLAEDGVDPPVRSKVGPKAGFVDG